MSNDITEAVRRLRGLREDVERLKSGENQEGVVRILQLAEETATTSDAVSTGPAAAATDAAVVDDTVALPAPSAATDATATDDAVTTGPTAAEADAVAADDAASTDIQTVSRWAWGETARWGIDTWDE